MKDQRTVDLQAFCNPPRLSFLTAALQSACPLLQPLQWLSRKGKATVVKSQFPQSSWAAVSIQSPFSPALSHLRTQHIKHSAILYSGTGETTTGTGKMFCRDSHYTKPLMLRNLLQLHKLVFISVYSKTLYSYFTPNLKHKPRPIIKAWDLDKIDFY